MRKLQKKHTCLLQVLVQQTSWIWGENTHSEQPHSPTGATWPVSQRNHPPPSNAYCCQLSDVVTRYSNFSDPPATLKKKKWLATNLATFSGDYSDFWRQPGKPKSSAVLCTYSSRTVSLTFWTQRDDSLSEVYEWATSGFLSICTITKPQQFKEQTQFGIFK